MNPIKWEKILIDFSPRKTSNLQNRLSSYNKTSEHEVIYYKECNKEHLNLIELNVLSKLKNYQEKANRDRFILLVFLSTKLRENQLAARNTRAG